MKRLIPALMIATVLLLLVVGWQLPMRQWLGQLEAWITGLGAFGVLAFVLLYVITTLLLGPASALTLLAGLAYGFWGIPLVILGATCGAAIAFLIGRYLARDRVQRELDRRRRFAAVNQAVSDEGWRIVMLFRLSPVIPFGLQNYFFSVSTLTFLPYIAATAIGILPGTALYVYLGTLGRQADAGALHWVMAALGLAATAAIVWLVKQRAQRALERMDRQALERAARTDPNLKTAVRLDH